MTNPNYAAYAAANPYFDLVRQALSDLVDGDHFNAQTAEKLGQSVEVARQLQLPQPGFDGDFPEAGELLEPRLGEQHCGRLAIELGVVDH